MIQFQPTAGLDIHYACDKAVAMANQGNDSVSFNFNGVAMVVAPGETAEAAVGRWWAQYEKNAEAYRNSPEGRAAKAAAEAREARCQRETTDLIARLPNVVRSLPDLVRWCMALSQSAGHVGIVWKPNEVADAIEAAGWKANAHVGRPKEDFDDQTIMGEWLVGQSIDGLRRGLPPHQVIIGFAEKAGFSRTEAT